MFTLPVDRYPREIAALAAPTRVCALGAGVPNGAARAQLRALSEGSLGPAIVDRDMASACLAGLWLLHDFLDESHAISQRIETPTGSFWHGIMHRREGDYSNAKYWFRRVGRHAIFPRLAEAAGAPHWDPFAFVDACEKATVEGADSLRLRQIARTEWNLLFDFCFRRATGGSEPP